MSFNRSLTSLIAIGLVAGFTVWRLLLGEPGPWTAAEMRLLSSMRLIASADLPADPTNAYSNDPEAARLGHALFFDHRLSGTGTVACATCHQPRFRFTDQLPTARAVGASRRNTPSLLGATFSPWLYWDGRKDSLWSQALSPLEDPAEHAGNRLQLVRLIASDPDYRQTYERLFGALPDFSDSERFPGQAAPGISPTLQSAWDRMAREDQVRVNRVFANIGKAIATYEGLLVPGVSRFDQYVDSLNDPASTTRPIFNNAEKRGLRLFIGRGNCVQCHNGPLLSNNSFHNTGVLSAPGRLPDRGRLNGIETVRTDPFNCLGRFSDNPGACAELRFLREGPETLGAFRTPSLRNLSTTAPYMHAGQIDTLAEVIVHYDRARPAMIGHNEAKPLGLWPWERSQLLAFLQTLDAPSATASAWLSPPADRTPHR